MQFWIVEPARKKARLNCLSSKKPDVRSETNGIIWPDDDFEITPPPSPEISKNIRKTKPDQFQSWYLEGLEANVDCKSDIL